MCFSRLVYAIRGWFERLYVFGGELGAGVRIKRRIDDIILHQQWTKKLPVYHCVQQAWTQLGLRPRTYLQRNTTTNCTQI